MTTAATASPTLREPQFLGQTVVLIGGSSARSCSIRQRRRVDGMPTVNSRTSAVARARELGLL